MSHRAYLKNRKKGLLAIFRIEWNIQFFNSFEKSNDIIIYSWFSDYSFIFNIFISNWVQPDAGKTAIDLYNHNILKLYCIDTYKKYSLIITKSWWNTFDLSQNRLQNLSHTYMIWIKNILLNIFPKCIVRIYAVNAWKNKNRTLMKTICINADQKHVYVKVYILFIAR